MSEAATVSPARLSRRAIGGTGVVKGPTKAEAEEDAAVLVAADELFENRRKAAAKKKGIALKSRAEPRDIKREFLDEDGNPITRRISREHNPFDVPKRLWRAGWDYEYKAIRVLGETADPSVVVDYRDGGWRNAPAKDFKELCPPGWDKPFVERGGQILMMRPMHLTIEARNESVKIAEDQKYDKLRSALAGPGELGKVTKRIVTENRMQTGMAALHPDMEE